MAFLARAEARLHLDAPTVKKIETFRQVTVNLKSHFKAMMKN